MAREDDDIFLLIGDVGYHLVEPYQQEFPHRFINIGIAEQNMTGIAAGMALCGKTVFIYSIANFPILRCLEQIRNDVCYHNANVKIVVAGGGLTYGALGATHHVTEDLAIMRSLPNITVVAPGDPIESALATRAVARWRGPCYLRLGKTGDPVVHQSTPHFQLGKAIRLREGKDVTLVTTGGMLCNTMQAAEQLGRQGIQSRVLSMHTVKPLDNEAVLAATIETESMVTIEEHSVIGGLGGAVAEVISGGGSPHINLMIIGIPDAFCSQVGSQKTLLETYSLSVEGIVASVKQFVKGRKTS